MFCVTIVLTAAPAITASLDARARVVYSWMSQDAIDARIPDNGNNNHELYL